MRTDLGRRASSTFHEVVKISVMYKINKVQTKNRESKILVCLGLRRE